MPATKDSLLDNFFKSFFKVLLTILAVLLSLKALLESYGAPLFIALLILSILVCLRLRLRRWPARIVAGLLIFLLLPALAAFVSQSVQNTSPITLALVLASISAGAYFVREHRQVRKPETVKTAGAERTPVVPPEDQQ